MKDADYKRALIQHRLERANITLSDAQHLHKINGSPVSIVNRSYYAMFYAALALLATVDKETSKHLGVLSLFDEIFVKTKIFPKEMSNSPYAVIPVTRDLSRFSGVSGQERHREACRVTTANIACLA